MADDVTGKAQGVRLPSRYIGPFRAFRSGMDGPPGDFPGGVPAFLQFAPKPSRSASFYTSIGCKENRKTAGREGGPA